ncbi:MULTISPECIES: SDR family NAD(P)-dependent oxidoreductase [Microbacterium]|uniref:SDR family NAD(P)-dependent oxidoreductase n=1 Tax=Microbacterium TaxID=33882 RepID=UPI002781FBBD|nr:MULTISPECIES: SDR family NAD(P)-dependent oxidoreductase [Microbacterium]MDQ1082565.1 NAD(P)-dependent dehydrogenase (short-subunit alcohol dehydrogenase family) [Microbacterium sp. SORGH_AS_0344]MDQ1168663.1 NAD(P)-dependent dehydrogenase (short-subunit alcohol dehydrogenase family) [Microbacterium proteolyticum]
MFQRVIVTGGSGGIGAAIVDRFLADGARVVVLDRRAPAEGSASTFVAVDLLDPVDTRRAIGDAVAELGGVDVLVNCAGIFQHVPLLDITVEDWDRVLDVNARATLVTMQAVAPVMLEARGGAIVNIASMAAKLGGGGEAHYAASKAAVVALTRAGAQEWGCHGVTVNAVCPGYVLTDMGADTRSEADIAAWSARSPLGRLGMPEDVAGVTHFLASPAGGYLTGQAINVTGGMLMH